MVKHASRKLWLTLALAALLVFAAGCTSNPSTAPTAAPPAGGGGATSAPAAQTITLNGAGATFPYPLISKWVSEYQKVMPNVQINYQSIGSGGGQQQYKAGTVDFAGSDAPLTDATYAQLPGVLHVPETIGGVVLTYNLPGVATGLKVTPAIIASIYLGAITQWNDPQITLLNPGVTLPNQNIVVVHRSDGSGTTYVWTDYLSKVSNDWKTKVGKSTSVNWPVGLGGKGNEGVSGVVKQTPYSVGYVEWFYAVNNKLPYASIKNAAGNFVDPTLGTIKEAVGSAASALPAGDKSWSAVSVTNAPGRNAWPISSMTYILLNKNQQDPVKGKALLDFLWWAIHDGQQYSSDLLYVPLPPEVVSLDETTLHSVTSGGQPLLAK